MFLSTPRVHGSTEFDSFAMTSTSNLQRAELQKLAYESLSKYFQEHEDEVVEIEVLPPAIQPPDGILMQDGLNLGVPKKILALAYVEARHRFFESIKQGTTSSTALQATKIMLLFDPEHLTAANFRKRRLVDLGADSDHQNGSVYHQALRQELCFLNSILTSPLHRQSKSPTLWYHRPWMVEPLVRIELNDASEDQKLAFWRNELAAVCKSGEQHPKNYHAWQYARTLVHAVDSPEITEDLAHRVKDWCCKHPSDISGWSFFLFLVSRVPSTSLKQDMVRDVVNYAITLRFEHESLWVFIRTVVAQDTLYKAYTLCYQMLQDYSRDMETSNPQSAILERVSKALTWIDTHRDSGVSTREPDSAG
jgi:hypothetical protein